jgi:ferredoxin
MRGTSASSNGPIVALVVGLLVEHTGAYRGQPAGARSLARPRSGACLASPRASVFCSVAGDSPEPFDPDAERLELGRQRMEEIFAQNMTVDTSAEAISATERLLQQLFPSSQFVGGGDLPTKFIFVDELTCIGCTHCRYVAPKTFMLEDDFGRARVFKQGGDDSDKIQEAIECCPVECIHQVSHTELVRLEQYREEKGDQLQGRFWKSRYVGSELGVLPARRARLLLSVRGWRTRGRERERSARDARSNPPRSISPGAL